VTLERTSSLVTELLCECKVVVKEFGLFVSNDFGALVFSSL
jgi:hypothetical protein